MSLDNLPVEWEKVALGNLATTITKGTTPTTMGFPFQSAGINFIKVESLGKNYIDKSLIYSFISEGAHEALKRSQLVSGDLLFSIAGTIGKTALVRDEDLPANTNQALAIIRGVSEFFDVDFLKYQLDFFVNTFKEQARGGAMNNISLQDLKSFNVIFVSQAEQQEIVRQLDVMLAQVEQIKARLDAIPAILKKFRQSVLADAVSGKLTEEWREQEKIKPQIKELQDLKDSLIKSKEIKKDLEVIGAETLFEIPENWGNLALQSFASKITDGEHSTPKRESAGHYLLSARNVRDGYIDVSNVDYVGIEEFSKLRKRCDPNKGDVLISCSGSVGRIALVDKDDEYVMVRSAALVKTLDSFIDNKFLMYVLQSPYLQKQIDEKSKSTAQSNLFLGQIKELSIPYPSLKEQKEIVQQVESLFKNASLIETAVQSAQKRVNLLTQSILAKAFSGELTAEWREQHQELITGVNSAESLLAKIQAEREASKSAKKTRKKKEV
ncbi:restriction endonuclease subunit S [Acinetobacter sp. TR3]|uniref:restriction endonuclease subunit S n=1 Tax=Acinetobacter sp. TR3 TaxID=3003392 RepID=UPI0022ABEA1C|nr:restriction endonuclease subunit S [Acinetobacter sp. TR3]WAU77580.1 restriction endonuclease subunit S [Acinetobacter sp. TR3]